MLSEVVCEASGAIGSLEVRAAEDFVVCGFMIDGNCLEQTLFCGQRSFEIMEALH